jgi:hypothetical protein
MSQKAHELIDKLEKHLDFAGSLGDTFALKILAELRLEVSNLWTHLHGATKDSAPTTIAEQPSIAPGVGTDPIPLNPPKVTLKPQMSQ